MPVTYCIWRTERVGSTGGRPLSVLELDKSTVHFRLIHHTQLCNSRQYSRYCVWYPNFRPKNACSSGNLRVPVFFACVHKSCTSTKVTLGSFSQQNFCCVRDSAQIELIRASRARRPECVWMIPVMEKRLSGRSEHSKRSERAAARTSTVKYAAGDKDCSSENVDRH